MRSNETDPKCPKSEGGQSAYWVGIDIGRGQVVAVVVVVVVVVVVAGPVG